MFERVLIANRGEIAVRIARTLREMGIRSVVVASIPDRRSLATRTADETVLLEGYSAAETYLDVEAIIAAAKATGCQAIHPGYGFLSERADFAERCAAEGIIFIGPPPTVLRSLGDKSSARRLAVEAGVPVVPGWDGDDDPATLAREAKRIGYPVMVKARGGGGGRGMRVVASADDLSEAVESARREALAAFGDGGLLLERLVTNAHHVEVQMFGDTHGNLVHLGERDCSVQRRRQKLIEESPSPVVDGELRVRLADAALRIARVVDYVNAGTVEFLVTAPGPDGRRDFYFLEVNPRLQVEHPVTEMVTGLDLVSWQLRVAAGEPLPLAQDAIQFEGHAIEFRINAEDPFNDFRPSSGRFWQDETMPPSPDVRIDAGFESGDIVPAQYDSLVAKVIVHGASRSEAVGHSWARLGMLEIRGIRSNLSLLNRIAARPDPFTIDELEQSLTRMLDQLRPPLAAWVAAGVGHLLPGSEARWIGAGPLKLWLDNGDLTESVSLAFDGPTRGVAIVNDATLRFEYRGRPDEPTVIVEGDAWDIVVRDDGVYVTNLGRYRPRVGAEGGAHEVALATVRKFHNGTFWIVPPPPLPRRAHAATEGGQTLLAPLSGTIAAVAATEGADVAEGDLLVVLEAMKMEHRLLAPSAGKVTAIAVGPGDVVREGDLLIELG